MPVEKNRSTDADAAAAEAENDEGQRTAPVSPVAPNMRDLAALLALPKMWRDRDASFIAGGLLDVLVSLLRSDVAYIDLQCGPEKSTYEMCRPSGKLSARELGAALASAFSAEDVATAPLPGSLGPGTVRLLRVLAQLDDQNARVVVGSRRAHFPTDAETFFCRIAVEQAMLAIHASRLVASLTTANAAKARFLATMSHELRTPLNAIIGYAELLHAEISGTLNVDQQHHIDRIEAAARHLLGLIEGILSFARLEAGKEEIHLSSVDAAHLAAGVMSLIQPLAIAKGLATRLQAPAEPPVVRTDVAKVRQILLNLLSNAVKFTEHGEITLDVSADEQSIRWSVMDTGIGISSRDLERVFEPFQQAIESHAGRAPGTGLGLSVSRQLARLLGGDVTATSTPGGGSCFVFRLPLNPGRDEASRGVSAQARKEDTS